MLDFLKHLRRSQELERELARRRRVEQELLEKQADLENRLAKLISANASLLAEIADGQRASMTEQSIPTELLREANRRKGEFLAQLGHELRNPLSAIAGANQVLSLIDSHEAESAQMRQIIERQTHHMSRMINELLEVSQVLRGRIQLCPVLLDLVELVRQTTEEEQPILGDGKLSVKLVLPDAPVQVTGDPKRLAQVLVHVLHDAAKSIVDAGVVTVTLGTDQEQRMAIVTVHETRSGMPPETLSRALEPFGQASSLPRSLGGLGLGLTLVKGMVELHGGQVSTTGSSLGRGAEWTIRLPLATPQSEIPQEERKDDTASPALRILIIDDQRDASYPLRKLLELDGHWVEVAADGPTGIEAASQIQPQVVLCDIGLPGGMNGFEVAQALRTDPRVSSALLVAVTGYSPEEVRGQSAAAGFDRHLTKPVGQSELRSLLSNVRFQHPNSRPSLPTK